MVGEEDGGLRSSVVKFLSEGELRGSLAALEAKPGDTLLLVGRRDRRTVLETSTGSVSTWADPTDTANSHTSSWSTSPVFDGIEDGDFVAPHHPFTAPVDVREMGRTPSTPSRTRTTWCSTAESSVREASGSTTRQCRRRCSRSLGIADEEAESRFGWFLEALRYGTPPHAGFAVGIDRLISILQGEPNIREIIPFPKTQSGADPLTGLPGRVAADQLGELGLEVTHPR